MVKKGGNQENIGESHRSLVTRCGSHFDLYKPGSGGGGGAGGGVRGEVEVGAGEEDEESMKAWLLMREHNLKCHGGHFSVDKL